MKNKILFELTEEEAITLLVMLYKGAINVKHPLNRHRRLYEKLVDNIEHEMQYRDK